jgi:hypothetical protein
MIRRYGDMNRGGLLGRESPAGVRAAIGAKKRCNYRGAKGGRKKDR